MVYIIFILFSIYFVILLLLLFGWNKAVAFDGKTGAVDHFLSVVVPMRNEEKTVASLIEDLVDQRYTHVEIILVDDHSSDNTYAVTSALIEKSKHIRLIKSRGNGKKAALAEGIGHARGTIIVTTDADCSLHRDWLLEINQSFQDESVKMAFGAVRIPASSTFFSKLQSVEFASVVATGAAAFALGSPIYCNGANLAFRKAVFEEVKGYEGNMHIPSGDDEFLLRKIHAAYPNGIRFMPAVQSIVSTVPAAGFSAFIQQRIRWAAKWRFSQHWVSKVFALSLVLFHGCVIGSFVWLFLGGYPPVLPILLLIKAFLEFVFLFSVCLFLKLRWQMLAFLVLQFTYSFYVAGIGIASNFIPYRWKERMSFETVK